VCETVTVVTGIDIQLIAEVESSVACFGDKYLKRIYSDHELRECDADENLARALAIRFAAKEAVIKALGPHDHIPPWQTIEVLRQAGGDCRVVLRGEAEVLARKAGIDTLSLSVSVTSQCAIAVVVAEISIDRDEFLR
jgi:holo-[acyl-carrier protein] synthase